MVSIKLFTILVLVHVYVAAENKRSNEGHERYRIVSGRLADIREFPYQASLEHYNQQWCGASIISKRILVTAAHCIQPIKKHSPVPISLMKIRVANSEACTGGETYTIQYVVPHERYNEDPSVDEHDISLIILSKPLKFGPKVKPIELASEEPKHGEMAWVTGFGRQNPMRRKAGNRHLMAIEIPIMNRDLCTKIHKSRGNVVTDKMICAGHSTGHRDSCKGDSGGPLVVNNKLAGIVAWGIGCGREGLPGVYTNVAVYLPWIKEKVAKIEEDSNKRNARELLYRFFVNQQL